jgi:hypothetical protein
MRPDYVATVLAVFEMIDEHGVVVTPLADRMKRSVFWMYFPSICWRAKAIGGGRLRPGRIRPRTCS